MIIKLFFMLLSSPLFTLATVWHEISADSNFLLSFFFTISKDGFARENVPPKMLYKFELAPVTTLQ